MRDELYFVEHQKPLVEWLERATPEERHCVASAWNRDGGYEILYWIITREDCDKATALDVFWVSEIEYYLGQTQEETRDSLARAANCDDTFELELVSEIARRFREGKYTRSVYRFYPSIHGDFRPELREKSKGHLTLELFDDLVDPIEGEFLPETHLYVEGWPPDLSHNGAD